MTLSFPEAAREHLRDDQLRRNVRHATDVIRHKRDGVVAEREDWQQLREAGSAIRSHVLENLDGYLIQFEQACSAAGGQVHWARDAAEANRVVLEILTRHEIREVIKVKSMTTEEIGLNAVLGSEGISAVETDLAELIVQLGHDAPSHIVVPALHKNRKQIRELFLREMHLDQLGETAEDLTAAARAWLRERFLKARAAISGANFLVAETGGVVIVESEGNGRMCLTLPPLLITIGGIEKVIPRLQDLEVFLQTLPRSATGERMNPYNSLWTGTTGADGPREFHVILLDNGRSRILADAEGRQTLKCIRCGACQNVCPVYRQTGGHAYGSVYGGPIGAILTPQLHSLEGGASLPYASSLCGACYEVCPVKIDIPEVLIHLRSEIVRKQQQTFTGALGAWNLGMQAAARIFASGERVQTAQKVARTGQWPLVGASGTIESLPFLLSGWTQSRDLAPIPQESFRAWWARRSRVES